MIVEGRLQDLPIGCLGEGVADLVVGSAPYYKKHGATEELACAFGDHLEVVLKPGARAFNVFGQVAEDFSAPYWFNLRTLGEGDDLRQEQTLFWIKSISMILDPKTGEMTNLSPEGETVPVKGHQTPLQGSNMVNDGVEFVFQYSKGPAKANPLDRLANGVAVPYADESNLTRGTRGKNGNRRCRGTAIFIPYPTTGNSEKKDHPHAYPEALVEYLIRLSGIAPRSTVVDFFHGGGATQRVAERMGMQYRGVRWEAK